MTFKHVKFEDSPTMRALEKVAKEKGLVKNEPAISKTASAPDLAPTDNLMSNVLKLCAGLRSQGLHKYANELEVNLLNYKRAQTLYETSKEKGEDLIGAAHPKGSHKLENVEGDEATVEDILEQHLKMMQVVEKKPHGKLSTASDAINAVRKIFAQDASGMTREQIESYVLRYIVERAWAIRNQDGVAAYKIAEEGFKNEGDTSHVWGLINSGLQDVTEAFSQVDKALKAMGANTPTPEILNAIIAAYKECINQSNDMSNTLVKKKAADRFTAAINNTSLLITQLQSLASNPSALPEGVPPPVDSTPKTLPEVTNVADPILGKGVSLINKLNGYGAIKRVSTSPAAQKWVKNQIAEIKDVMTRFNKAAGGPEDREAQPGVDSDLLKQIRPSLQGEMDQKEKEVNDFYNWAMATK